MFAQAEYNLEKLPDHPEDFFDIALGQSLSLLLALEGAGFLVFLFWGALFTDQPQTVLSHCLNLGGAALCFYLSATSRDRFQPHLDLFLGLTLAAGVCTALCLLGMWENFAAVMQICIICIGVQTVRLSWAAASYLVILSFAALGMTSLPEGRVNLWLGLAAVITPLVSVFILWLRRGELWQHFADLKSELLMSHKLDWLSREHLKKEAELSSKTALIQAELKSLKLKVSEASHARRRVNDKLSSLGGSDLGRMASGVAHDVNNLLTVIRLNLNCLEEAVEPGNEEASSSLVDALKSCSRMEAVVKQFVAFSSTKAPQKGMVSLSERLEGYQYLLNALMREDLELEFLSQGEERKVYVDPRGLDLLLFSLSSQFSRNARPGARLTVELIFLDDKCRLRLLDSEGILSGLGIPNLNVFGTESLARGRGFTYLAVSRILSNNTEQFAFTESGIECDFSYQEPAANDSLTSLKTPVTRTKGSVLLFERDPLIRRFLERELTARGFSMVSLSEVEGLNNLPAGINPVVLITDYDEPQDKSGGLVRRAASVFPNLSYLFFTTHAGVQLPQDLRFQLLVKPFSLIRLQTLLGELVERDN